LWTCRTYLTSGAVVRIGGRSGGHRDDPAFASGYGRDRLKYPLLADIRR